jgi:exopolyphosphatase/pppGpp-phosphohydrolase
VLRSFAGDGLHPRAWMGLINSIELAVSGEIRAGLLCRLLRLESAIWHVKQSIHQRSELSYVLNCDIPGCRNPDISLVGIARFSPDTASSIDRRPRAPSRAIYERLRVLHIRFTVKSVNHMHHP